MYKAHAHVEYINTYMQYINTFHWGVIKKTKYFKKSHREVIMERRLGNTAVAEEFMPSNKICDLTPCLSSDGLRALPASGTQLQTRAYGRAC